MEDSAQIGSREIQLPKEKVDLQKEKEAHEFRAEKRVNSPYLRAVLQVLRDDEAIWQRIEPTQEQQRRLEEDVLLPGETHLVGSSLFSNIYRDPEAAVLYDIALFDTTQNESDFFKKEIYGGNNYSPLSIVGAGGVYGTIVSASILKETPNNPAFGFDAGKRRGGIWTISGDVTQDIPFWRMNSRNRPENRKKLPLPGSDGNLNSLGAEVQNLQVPFISSAQYPSNNELGRVLEHNSEHSGNIVINAELVKVRINRNSFETGKFQEEYQDKTTGERFYHYTDTIIQATGLGKEDLGFSPNFSSTLEVLEQVNKDLAEGAKTPLVLTFFQLVEAATSNRKDLSKDFESFGLVGKGDTSKVTREFFIGIGGIDPGVATQLGAIKEVLIFGLENKTREELAKSERPRYILGLLEFERDGGGFFKRIRPVEGRVKGVGLAPDGKLVVYFQRTDQTPEGPVITIGKEVIPRLITAAGFTDETDKIYSGLTAQVVDQPDQIQRRLEDALSKQGSTIYYKNGVYSRLDIDRVSPDRKTLLVTRVGMDGIARAQVLISKEGLFELDRRLLDSLNISKLEIAGKPPEFKPVIDQDYDSEIPVAEKAEGFEIYKAGGCTNLPILEKERKQTKAYERVGENSKSIFRFVRRTIAFARKIAQKTERVEGAINLERYNPKPVDLSNEKDEEVIDTFQIRVDTRANAQKFSANLRQESLLKYLSLSRLNAIFPQDLKELRFGVKRVEDPSGRVPFNLNVQLNIGIPKTEKFRELLKGFMTDNLTQRLFIQLTGKSSEAAEVSIGIKDGKVDIRKIESRSIKNDEEREFLQKYPMLAVL